MNHIKIILILILILIVNFFFKEVIFFENIRGNLFFKISYKVILIIMVCLLTMKLLKRDFILFKNNKYFIPITSILVFISFLNNLKYDVDLHNHLLFILSCFSVGIFEELLFRVLIFYLLLKVFNDKITKKNMLLACMLSSLYFALAHIFNFFNPEYLSISVINQILFAFGIGLVFQSIYLRFNNIIIVITLHSLINYFGGFKNKLIGAVENEIVTNYTFEDFLQTFILFLIFNVFFAIPVSYLSINSILKNNYK